MAQPAQGTSQTWQVPVSDPGLGMAQGKEDRGHTHPPEGDQVRGDYGYFFLSNIDPWGGQES